MKTVDFSETIAASDLKVSRSRLLFQYMKICEYIEGQGTKFCMKAFRYKEMKI